MTEYNGGSTEADHLCVLVHGLWGNPDHLHAVAGALRDAYSEDELHILVVESNSGFLTYDGIDVGGERVCLEIEDTLAAIEAKGGRIARISVIGYSLGGLVSRYAIGLLHAKGVLDRMECMTFAAFASPFLGVRSPNRGLVSTAWNAIGPRAVSTSGRQLFGVDTFRDTGRPLLSVLADPASVFMAGLARFRRRTLYANIVNDRTAAHYTCMIAKTDPYGAAVAKGMDLRELPLRFVPGYGDIVLDVSEPSSRTSEASGRASAIASTSTSTSVNIETNTATTATVTSAKPPAAARRTLSSPAQAQKTSTPNKTTNVTVTLSLTGIVRILATAMYQVVESGRRRKLHEDSIGGNYSRLPLWIQNLQLSVEGVYDSITSTHDHEHAANTGEDGDGDGSGNGDEASSLVRKRHQRNVSLSQKQLQDEARGDLKQVLALTPEQFAMIENLDSLGWRKYPVWIHKVGHSHSAIISRRRLESHDEGKTVLRHFINEEFLIR